MESLKQRLDVHQLLGAFELEMRLPLVLARIEGSGLGVRVDALLAMQRDARARRVWIEVCAPFSPPPGACRRPPSCVTTLGPSWRSTIRR